MKRSSLHIAEILYCLTFLLYLFGSALTHIENGAELSLWLMSFAVVLTASITLLPLVGVRWLRMKPQGCRIGFWVAMALQGISWISFSWAMFLRLRRVMEPFHRLITLTTLIWAAWLLIFIFSRYAFSGKPE
jgi:hypothetical protein